MAEKRKKVVASRFGKSASAKVRVAATERIAAGKTPVKVKKIVTRAGWAYQ